MNFMAKTREGTQYKTTFNKFRKSTCALVLSSVSKPYNLTAYINYVCSDLPSLILFASSDHVVLDTALIAKVLANKCESKCLKASVCSN